MASEKKRISVTLTEPYLEGIDYLVSEGLYLSRGEFALEAFRRLLKDHHISPFYLKRGAIVLKKEEG